MYKRRAKIFLAIIGLGLACMGVRLWNLQIVNGNSYRRQYERTMVQPIEPLPAMRGQILDRHGRILAMDRPCFDLCLDYRFLVADPNWIKARKKELARQQNLTPQQADELYRQLSDNTWRIASQAAAVAPEELAAVVRRIVTRVNVIRAHVISVRRDVTEIGLERQAHAVVTGLSEESAADIKLQLAQTVGASVAPSRQRWYPAGAAACHVIGVTGPVDRAEQDAMNLAEDDADELTRMLVNYLDGDTLGKSGVERMCERQLRGQRGCLRYSELGGEPEVIPSIWNRC